MLLVEESEMSMFAISVELLHFFPLPALLYRVG